MKVLERKESGYVELMAALLQLMRILTNEEMSRTLAANLKDLLDNFMVRATFFSYVKRKTRFNCLGRDGKIIETICGKNHSKEVFKKHDLNAGADKAGYKKIERFRDRCRWEKIIFRDLREDSKDVEKLSGPSIVILDNVSLLVFENIDEMRNYFNLGYAQPHSFFRLYQEDKKLTVLYSAVAEGCININWSNEALMVGGVKLASF